MNVIDIVCTSPLLVDINNRVSECDTGFWVLLAVLVCGLSYIQ